MIIIEPPESSAELRASLGKRNLQQFLARAKKALPLHGAVSVLLTTDKRIRDLNRRFRHKDKATDVLSFPTSVGGEVPASRPSGSRRPKVAGDLAISYETASRQAEDFGHELAVEIKVLMLHGLLHLAGLDHETDSGEMAAREQELRKQLNLPLGLIQRSDSVAVRPGEKTAQHLPIATSAVGRAVPKARVAEAKHGASGSISVGRGLTKRRGETR